MRTPLRPPARAGSAFRRSGPGSTWTERRSRTRLPDEQDRRQQGVASRASGVPVRGIQRDRAADDRRQLFRAGHPRSRPESVRRHRMVRESADGSGTAWRALPANRLFVFRAGNRNAARRGDLARVAGVRLARVAVPGAAGAAAAHSLERRRHDLADFRPRRHRTRRSRRQPARYRLQLHGLLVRRVDHRAGHGHLALDAARRAAFLRGPARHSRRVLPGGEDRRRNCMGGLPLHPAAEAARRAADRTAPSVHGQLHDLHRAVRAHRRRAGQCDHVPLAVPHPPGGGPVRRRAGGGVLADLFPDHPAVLLRVLHGDRGLRQGARTMRKRSAALVVYFIFVLLPIYWMVNMSFKENEEITGLFSLFPRHFTTANYRVIFTDPSWYGGYINSILYVVINTLISVTVALPAAYAF